LEKKVNLEKEKKKCIDHTLLFFRQQVIFDGMHLIPPKTHASFHNRQSIFVFVTCNSSFFDGACK
jgi:hypothetical protein